MTCVVATCLLEEAYCPLAGSNELWEFGMDEDI